MERKRGIVSRYEWKAASFLGGVGRVYLGSEKGLGRCVFKARV